MNFLLLRIADALIAGAVDQVSDTLLEVGLDDAQSATLSGRKFRIDGPENIFLHGSQCEVVLVYFLDSRADLVIGRAFLYGAPQRAESSGPSLSQFVPLSQGVAQRRQDSCKLVVIQFQFLLKSADVEAFNDFLYRGTITSPIVGYESPLPLRAGLADVAGALLNDGASQSGSRQQYENHKYRSRRLHLAHPFIEDRITGKSQCNQLSEYLFFTGFQFVQYSEDLCP